MSQIKTLLALGLFVIGGYYLFTVVRDANWDALPEPSPEIEHEGDDYSSTPFPSCLPYGNSNVPDPNLPHTLCFDGSGSYARGPATRFL
jgi:hypothetical protein